MHVTKFGQAILSDDRIWDWFEMKNFFSRNEVLLTDFTKQDKLYISVKHLDQSVLRLSPY